MDSDLRRELEIERRLLEEIKNDKLMSRIWTPVQRRFANSLIRERLISGGNQIGKTDVALAITAMHLEGRYPKWYTGHKFTEPVVWAIAGPTSKGTRENMTDRLLGHRSDRGTGWIRGTSFSSDDISYIQRDSVDEVWIAHSSGGRSLLKVFSYDQGARRLQGRTVNGITIDESPKLEVVEELSQRLNATRGILIGAVSPKEEDAVEVIDLFEESGDIRGVFYYGINDATWMPLEQRQEIIKKNEYNPFKEATLHGRPVARSGLLYKTPQDNYTVRPEPYAGGETIIGIDLPHSTGHFAAVRVTKHRGVWRVEREWKCSGLTIDEYATAVLSMGGATIPCVFPHDGGRVVGDGYTAAEAYRQLGLNVVPQPAHMIGVDGKKHRSIVTIVEKIALMLANGELVISSDCPALLKELARYRWAKGKVGTKPKRLDDHLHDALCKAVMMLEYAESGMPPPPMTPVNSTIANYISRGYTPLRGRFGSGPRKPWRSR